MPRHREKIKFILAVSDEEPLDSDSVAIATAKDLQTNTVSEWAARVEEVIASARRLTMPTIDQADPVSERAAKKQSIEAQIAELQRQLAALDEDQ